MARWRVTLEYVAKGIGRRRFGKTVEAANMGEVFEGEESPLDSIHPTTVEAEDVTSMTLSVRRIST